MVSGVLVCADGFCVEVVVAAWGFSVVCESAGLSSLRMRNQPIPRARQIGIAARAKRLMEISCKRVARSVPKAGSEGIGLRSFQLAQDTHHLNPRNCHSDSA